MLEVFKVFLFGENAFSLLQKKLNNVLFFFAGLILFAITLSLPAGEVKIEKIAFTFAVSGIGFAIVIFLSFILTRFFGRDSASKKHFKEFSASTAILGAAGSIISLAIISVGLAVNSVFESEAFASLATSLVPFYSFVFFAWSCEQASGLKSAKAIIVGLTSLALFVALHLIAGS